VRRAPRRARAAVLAGMAIVTTGCDYLRDTTAQEVANRRFKACSAGTREVQLQRVDLDGRIRFTYVSLDERNRVLACLEAAGRDTDRLPYPLAVSPSGK
jgi:hypothetical protein